MKKPFLIAWVSTKLTIINFQKNQKAALLRELKERREQLLKRLFARV
jgi:hypothetical protein